MDRWSAADVGFGKTEVALRAAFVAVADHAVAVLRPRRYWRAAFHTFPTASPTGDQQGALALQSGKETTTR